MSLDRLEVDSASVGARTPRKMDASLREAQMLEVQDGVAGPCWEEPPTAKHGPSAVHSTTGSEMVGRVVEDGRLLRVELEHGTAIAEPNWSNRRTLPRSRSEMTVGERPVCGDWVAIELFGHSALEQQRGRVRRILQRRNVVKRSHERSGHIHPMVANIDEGWIVCGLDRDSRLRNLRRYQTMLRSAGVSMVVVLNKIDLVENVEAVQTLAFSLAGAAHIVSLSALTRAGIGSLEARLLPGRTIALLGASGSGKSTLVNAVLETSAARTGSVDRTGARGRHTTVSSCLYTTERGAFIIDTPGSRELGVCGSQSGLAEVFERVDQIGRSCRFSDCRHDTEPDCAVRAALDAGLIVPEEFLSYLELQSETNRNLRPWRKLR